MKQKTSDYLFHLSILLLLIFLLFSLLFAINLGSVSISAGEVYGVILHHLQEWSPAFSFLNISQPDGKVDDVVWQIRLPRLVLACAAGMALSISGVVMQAVVQNPMAEPYVLGISSGASLGATLAIMLGIGNHLGPNFVGIMASLGAFIISLGVVFLSNVGGRSNSVKLLLSGMALSSVCSAFSSFIVYFSKNREGMRDVAYWLMGSFAGAKWETNAAVIMVSLLGALFFITQYRKLNIMLLGDNTALTLGTDPRILRQIYLLVSSVMVGFVIFTSGTIGFVGLIVPHAVRIVFGSDHKKIMPVSALVGAAFLLWADVACRVILPGRELPIGILTSMIGAPCFIFLMVKRKYSFGGRG